MLEHGGNLWKASRLYGIPRHAWIDLSTGINPHPWQGALPPPSLWQELPQDMDLLERAAASYYGIDNLCACAGSQAAIQWLPALRQRFFGLSRIAVPQVGYAEHRRCWALWHNIHTWTHDTIEHLLPDIDVLVVINPNNPSGERFSREQLLHWHQTLAARDGWLIVDEAYIDTRPEDSLAADSNRHGLFLLRSVGKFFGLGGMRAGFVLGEGELLEALRELMGPWHLTSPTRWIAEQALRDEPWQIAMRERLIGEAQYLRELLHQFDSSATIHGTDLFKTFYTPHASALFKHLAQHGILTRLTDEQDAVRFGLPADEPQWLALSRALDRFEP